MGNCFIFRLSRVTHEAIHADVCACKFSVKNPKEFPKPDESGHAQNINFQPQRVFQFVAGATPFNVQPGEACQCFKNRP